MDNFAVTTRINGADMEWVDKATGTVPFALRASKVVDLSTATSVLLPGSMPNFQSTITLTAAQIKALRATPQTLVAAQGAGTLILVTSIVYDFIYTAPAMDTSTGVFQLYWNHSSTFTAIGTNGLASAIITGSANTVVGDTPALPGSTSGVVVANCLNNAVVVRNSSATEYATGGSSCIVTIGYRVISGLS